MKDAELIRIGRTSGRPRPALGKAGASARRLTATRPITIRETRILIDTAGSRQRYGSARTNVSGRADSGAKPWSHPVGGGRTLGAVSAARNSGKKGRARELNGRLPRFL